MTDAAPTPCEHPGCTRPGFECRNFAVDDAEFPPEYYCGEHAPEHGYCAMCGDFVAGTNGFDFLHIGLCDHCHDEVINEQFDDEDFDEAGWIDEMGDDDEFPLGLDDVEDPEYLEDFEP